MTAPRKPIELNYVDLLGGGAAAGPQIGIDTKPAAGPPAGPEVETGGDMLGAVNSMIERANGLITNFKDLLTLIKGGGPQITGPAGPPQPYQPQPTLAQQAHTIANVLYAAYGDITVVELLQRLVAQYGKVKLSEVLKALGQQK